MKVSVSKLMCAKVTKIKISACDYQLYLLFSIKYYVTFYFY